MSELSIPKTTLETLKDFYALMDRTRKVRHRAVELIFGGKEVPEALAESLRNAQASLEAVPQREGKRVLSFDGDKDILLDIDYEVNECAKDVLYFEKGEKALLGYLAELHPDFEKQVQEGVKALSGGRYHSFVTDRDGTVNNYCGRYRSSIQSAYNAVFLTRFAQRMADNPVVLTSAPLMDVGLVEISVNPEYAMYYAGSKGRECLDLEGRVRQFPIDPDKQQILRTLNEKLTAMLHLDEYEKFSLIGSGLQFKFGQTTVARQDISGSVPARESEAFLRTLEEMVVSIDPKRENFRIEDTGLDVEIILTISGDSGLKDFDKGDGVRFLNEEFEFRMFEGRNLICGDTSSDVPMLEASLSMNGNTRTVFVTEKEELAARVRGLAPEAVIVPQPDMLVTMLGRLEE
jgi:hydroxymethylpyrimidine pyrophosphatase-like HAD family hydrolase